MDQKEIWEKAVFAKILLTYKYITNSQKSLTQQTTWYKVATDSRKDTLNVTRMTNNT